MKIVISILLAIPLFFTSLFFAYTFLVFGVLSIFLDSWLGSDFRQLNPSSLGPLHSAQPILCFVLFLASLIIFPALFLLVANVIYRERSNSLKIGIFMITINALLSLVAFLIQPSLNAQFFGVLSIILISILVALVWIGPSQATNIAEQDAAANP